MPRKRGYKNSISTIDRLLEKVKINSQNGCWEWQANMHRTGYGKFTINGKTILAHRASYQLHIGEIPNGMLVCHSCDNKKCINPEHFFLGTHKDNAQDSVNKDRRRKPDPHPSVAWYKHHGCRCPDCVALHSAYKKQERENNPERIKAQKQRYYQNNKEKCDSRSKAWALNNPERSKESSKNRQRRYREKLKKSA